MMRFLRQTLVIARRDFMAIVFTPTFLVFLLAPLLMLGFGAIGGVGAARLAESGQSKARLVAILPALPGAKLAAADKHLRTIFRTAEAPPELILRAPGGDPAAQAKALFADRHIEAAAILYGSLERPTILHGARGERSGAYLAEAAEAALRQARGGTGRLSEPKIRQFDAAAATDTGRQSAGFGAVFAMFFLTLLLAGQSVGMLAEERNSKVIEILAAAVPLEAVFLGKLVGMFGVALAFIAFWAALLSQGIAFLPGGGNALASLAPAIGLPLFVLLFLAYFTLAFLLLGAVFLGVGAQASTMREIQMLSLPITFFQVGMFALASAAASNPDSMVATAARVLPFSSPFAMAARAATSPALMPHLLAIGWQLLWVAIIVALSARLFRRGVLKSGPGIRIGRTKVAAPAD